MPRYEFRCRACGDTFEVERPMSEASQPAACPEGHEDTVKLLTTANVVKVGSPQQGGGGGGCCGGGCCG
ncbi:MAG: zinc ribbon domain-containing protein [Hamadaea sp.]|uniref:FmdB family zinc ribbon protein n=1 Tax=unclassified Hamadaea TaxID=2640021 RepID=UPI0017DF8EF7|nr:zinc ribbon domain-containing protein [Hamadaea sp.]NUR51374.1 zinc ribbon domain-containing protein [Hamadaea sp.]NUR73938.1 zinc ribbon domain-containing protein [Hamadaea sp.]NUT02298.1 zinc ribbon domain-containing protein [Hamadaea sp.]